jgi:hypothetical protein
MTAMVDCSPAFDHDRAPAAGEGQWRRAHEVRPHWQVRIDGRWLDVVHVAIPYLGSVELLLAPASLLSLSPAAPLWTRTPDEVDAAADAETQASIALLTEALLGECAGGGDDGQ